MTEPSEKLWWSPPAVAHVLTLTTVAIRLSVMYLETLVSLNTAVTPEGAIEAEDNCPAVFRTQGAHRTCQPSDMNR